MLIIVFLILSPLSGSGSSAGDDDTPPPPPGSSGGGGGGGGAPEFYDYYIPLVYNQSHSRGESSVVIWFPQPSILITSFGQNLAGVSATAINTPQRIEFKPSTTIGLTNGSLVRTTTPVLITGQRMTEDITSDVSFAYSIIPSRMMGFEYTSPFDGWISLFTLSQNTQVSVTNPDGTTTLRTIRFGGMTGTFSVKKGSYINSTFPTNGAFISFQNGTSASMAVPFYLQGTSYVFDANPSTLRQEEIDQSTISVLIEEPTELTFEFVNDSISKVVVFDTTDFIMDPNLRSINSSRSKISVVFNVQTLYAGLIRKSTVQLFSDVEMRSGEWFILPKGFTSKLATINDGTTYSTFDFVPEISSFVLGAKDNITKNRLETYSFNGQSDAHLLIGNHSSFGYLTSPGDLGHPMSPSASFVNPPINTATSRNITGILATWYRFPNLAVFEIQIEPGPAEEYTGQEIKVVIVSNGSLPASQFNLEIIIDEEIEVDETYDFLQVNDTLVFKFDKFLSYGKEKLNVTVSVDTDNQVNEINEEDNDLSFGVDVEENIRLRYSAIGLAVIMVVYITYGIFRSIRRRSVRSRSHVDVILNFEEED